MNGKVVEARAIVIIRHRFGGVAKPKTGVVTVAHAQNPFAFMQDLPAQKGEEITVKATVLTLDAKLKMTQLGLHRDLHEIVALKQGQNMYNH
jgi:hypothetical protein